MAAFQMNMTRRLRSLLADHEVAGSLSFRARRRRWAILEGVFPDLQDMYVLDLGGTVESWVKTVKHPRHVLIINEYPQTSQHSWISTEVADACSLSAEMRSRTFDLIYSNSVLEHVGGFARRQAFAKSVHAFSTRYWIQTPYRYFPIEPHWVFPGFQFMPLPVRIAIARHWVLTRAHHAEQSREEALELVLSVELIGRTEMKHYFPECHLLIEKFAGMPKSLIAVRA